MMLICQTRDGSVAEQSIRPPQSDEVAWIRLENREPYEVKQILGEMLHCHPLLVEDAIKLNQRPKMDKYSNNIFVTFFAVDEHLNPQEIAIVISDNYLVTIHKQKIPFIDQLYMECKEINGRMRHPGLMLHALLDRCVDDYSEIVNYIDDRIDKMERGIYRNPAIRIAQEIFQLKRTLHQLRRVIVEEKTILNAISYHTFPYKQQEDDVYFVDIYDHISRVVDSLDIFRESLTGLLELQMNMKSDRMNEIMKTLTVFSTIFMPLTFIVGLYGMNFRNMPELGWEYGYLFVWVLLIAVGVALWLYFKKKRWF